MLDTSEYDKGVEVAPLAGAWIEISWDGLDKTAVFRRPPRGGVD